MSTTIKKSDELERRRFMSLAAKGLLGVSILPWANSLSLQGAGLGLNRPLNHAPKAKNVIYLYMSGGMTHLDTFDPKPVPKLEARHNQLKHRQKASNLRKTFPCLPTMRKKLL